MELEKLKFYIVGGDGLCERMVYAANHTTVKIVDDCDIILFTGGADVTPGLYGHVKNAETRCDPTRDAREMDIYYKWVGKKPMVGICRGGQFLHVMNGGVLYQHVDNHTLGDGKHPIYDFESGKVFYVTSTHHQMMSSSGYGKLLAYAYFSTSKQYSGFGFNSRDTVDIETMYYNTTNCLCFQPHPEYTKPGDDTFELFFRYINTYTLSKG